MLESQAIEMLFVAALLALDIMILCQKFPQIACVPI